MTEEIPFAGYCSRVQAVIEDVYGIRVVTRDIPDPLTGDLDGAEIHIDYAVTPEQRLFLLVHLFGHTVQWNVKPETFALGQLHQPPVDEALMGDILNYEREAASFALGMLHQVGIVDIDQWLADYTQCDGAYLTHYYRTGEAKEFTSFWRDHAALVEPLPIPSFVPAKRVMRSDGLVI